MKAFSSETRAVLKWDWSTKIYEIPIHNGILKLNKKQSARIKMLIVSLCV